ncbi:MAG: TraR/DksA family transcriptional regulator [Gammaproteobacteria bacterium]|nr:TraR/DksA family transcriptional regulator [Gammaproteobacteria bacterium]NNM13094.1 TraR/DksA family transcriptional regulator [Gammaproteobacteria bacterium]
MKSSKHFKQQLIDLKTELQALEATGQEAAETVELDQTRMGRLSRMDAMQQQAMSKATNQRRKLKLQQIDAALERIDNDEFGYCIECDEDINPKRLEYDPTTLLCIQCASEKES